MRIAGGSLKGRIIETPKIRNIRPSTEKTREAIFSILGTDVLGIKVADLFCGSGALGLEALSRGASFALFMDVHRGSTDIVRGNIKKLKLENQARAMTMNVFEIRPKHLDGIKMIFADPPYGGGYASKLVTLLSLPKFEWYGILVLEHESTWHYEEENFQILKRARFGDTSVSFLIREKESAGSGQVR
jgi:16S rRNA (guanine966-N2)-methyltransferase